jgi:hypothetical protein
MGADISKFQGCLGLRYKFSQQRISKDSKHSRRHRVGIKNTENERSGTTVFSLTSAALKFQESPQSKQNWPHASQPAPLTIKNAEVGSVIENYK